MVRPTARSNPTLPCNVSRDQCFVLNVTNSVNFVGDVCWRCESFQIYVGDVCGFVWWEVLLLEMYVGDVNPFRSLWNTCCLPNTIDALPLPAKSLTQKFKCFVLIFHNGRHQVFHKFTLCSFNYKDSTNYTCLEESSLILPLVVWIDGPRLNTVIELC